MAGNKLGLHMFKATEKNLNLFIMPSAYTLEMNEKSDACAIK